jgi:dTDP-4-dehydrorhamnose reductase
MKKVLITGADGQLGHSMRKISPLYPGLNFIYIDIKDIDITDEPALAKFIKKNTPDVILNCAAYTAVDKAEEEPDKAMLINAGAVRNLARLSKELGIFMIHISTDYVFDGYGKRPYLETDITHPVSSYGNSKLQGEINMMESGCNGIIFRTSWLYSEYGNNFLKTIQRLAAEREELKIVADQTGTPTYARDLGKVILDIVSKAGIPPGIEIYHYSNEGICSWYEFAIAIVNTGHYNCRVSPIPTTAYPLPAKRPMYSVLNKEKIKNTFGIEIPRWDVSLRICMANMISEG